MVHATQQTEQQYTDEIKNQTAQIVSDGSYARGRSSAAFVTQYTHARTPLRREVDQNGYIQSQETKMNKTCTEANSAEY